MTDNEVLIEDLIEALGTKVEKRDRLKQQIALMAATVAELDGEIDQLNIQIDELEKLEEE
jgi:phage shock protein A